MRTTRRGFFAALLAPAIAPYLPKPVVNLSLGEFSARYIAPAVDKMANCLLTRQEITYESLWILENNTTILPSFYREGLK